MSPVASDHTPLLSNKPDKLGFSTATEETGESTAKRLYGTSTDQPEASSSGSTTPTDDPDSLEGKNGHWNLQGLSHGHFLWILIAVWSACFVGALDMTLIATLLTSIGSSFESSNMASWLGTSYLLSVSCFTPIYGRLCDIAGRRGAMLIALFFFVIGTLLCSIAPSMYTLIAARAIAGIGGGGMTTAGNIIISDLVPLKRRGTYQGLANLWFGLGSGLGGPVGGWMAGTIGWRWAFGIQVPLLLVSAIIIFFKVDIPLPSSNQTLRERLARIDYLGILTLVTSTASLLVSLTLKTAADVELAWSDPKVWGLLVVSGVFAVTFALIERFVAREPIMPFSLLMQRTPACICAGNFLLSMTVFSLLYNFPLWFEAVKGASAAEAGAHLLPNSIALAIGSLGAGLLMRWTGKYWWLTVGGGTIAFTSAFLLATFTPGTPKWLTWLAIMPNGLGMSIVITTTLIALIGNVKKEEIAVSTGLTYLFRTTGQVLGVSISAAILQALLTRKLEHDLPGQTELVTRIRHSTSLIQHLDPDTKFIAVSAYQSALHAVFIFQAIAGFLALLSVMGMKEVPMRDTVAAVKPDPTESNEGNVVA